MPGVEVIDPSFCHSMHNCDTRWKSNLHLKHPNLSEESRLRGEHFFHQLPFKY